MQRDTSCSWLIETPLDPRLDIIANAIKGINPIGIECTILALFCSNGKL